jgi:LPXTG-site transpeptidase (sortase) family protein
MNSRIGLFVSLCFVTEHAEDKMRKLSVALLVAALIGSFLGTPNQAAHAQGITLPAEINKKFTPISIAAGDTSVLSITIFNPNIFALSNASWTDNLIRVQPGLQVANPPDITNTCGGSVSTTSTSISLTGGTVPAQSGSTPGSCTVTVRVTSFARGSLINTIPSGALTSTGGGTNISNTSPASATLNVDGTIAPSVSKSFNPSTIWVGGTSRLTITIRNSLPSTTLTNAFLTDNLPANVFLADLVSPVLSGCGTSASLTADPGGSVITLSNGTIAPASSCTITVSVTSDVQGSYNNIIPANSLSTDQGITNPTPGRSQLTVQEIGLTKRFSPSSFATGQTTTLIITLQNPTSTPYTGASVTDTLPAPLVVAGTATTTCGGTISTTTNSVSLSGGTIPAGTPTALGTCEIQVPVTVPPGTPSGTFRNTIVTGGLTTNQGIGNPRPATSTVTVLGSDILAIKSFSPSTISAGGNSRLRIDITAPGDTDLTNFTITDPLPQGLTISNSTPATATGCGPTPPLVLTAQTGTTSISLTNGLIPAGQRCRIDVFVTGTAQGSFQNVVTPGNITNTEGRQPAGDITATLNINGGATQAIELVKGFDPLIVTGGASSTMSVQLINPGTATLTGITFTDTMPPEMILADPVNFNVGTCGGTLTGTPGSNSFSFSGGSLPPQGKCTLTLSATMTANGNLTNTIPAGSVTTANGITNSDPVEASLTNLPGASVSKSFSPNPISPGSISQLTITIRNTGNIELVQMGVTDNLPTGLNVSGSSAPVNECGGTLTAVAGSGVVQLTNGTLAGNSSCRVVVAITGDAVGQYTNTIPVGGLTANPGTQNNQPATDTLTITNTGTSTNSGGKKTTSKVASPFLIPVTGFQPGVVTNMSGVPHETYLSTGDIMLEIPALGVDIPIVGVPKRDGTWNVSWLADQAGWLEGSAFPSWNGNSVLTGHVYLSNGLPGPFINLNKLKYGDRMIVHAYGQKYVFAVQISTVVDPTDSSVMKHEEKPWLTLVTCKDYDERTDTYLSRLIVRAALVSVQWE